jgi:general secretion pathway protein E
MTPLLPYPFARAHQLLVQRSGQGLAVRASAASSLAGLAEVRRVLGTFEVQVEAEETLREAINRAYQAREGSAQSVVDQVSEDVDIARLMEDTPAVEDLLESADDAPIIRLINALLTQAVREGASDVHIEAFEDSSVVRLRIDGTLRDIARPKRALHAALISRIKIMAQLDIAEKRLPQDGRITLRVAGRPVDVRVSTLPTGFGERVVLRLLDKSNERLDLRALGMSEDDQVRFDTLIKQPHGIVLVTGPTGSGKTTTLYAGLKRLDVSTTNVMTVEDPIEYELRGVGQTQVNPKIDLTFAAALRAILRQDPDVIMIGEIRDLETAQIAVQASLTGHLVLATVHTNDAPSTITRLADMGIEPFLLSSSLLGVLAQRLVRRLCTACRKPEMLDGRQVWRPVGCAECSHTGYVGRTGIYELLLIDETIQRLIHEGANEQQIRQVAQTKGMRSMREDGERYVLDGTTSPEEVLRVTRDT